MPLRGIRPVEHARIPCSLEATWLSARDAIFDDYLAGLRSGSDDALHALMEIGPTVIPPARSAYATERDPQVRADLVHVVWQQRCADALPMLEAALCDDDPRVWKEAIDGLVTLGSPEARRVLVSARGVNPDRPTGGKLTFAEWIADAIEQLDQART